MGPLPHESHDTLRWYFERAGIKHIISLQVHGKKLQVSGIGNFDVEWHLGGDLKTLKCMLGCKGGAKLCSLAYFVVIQKHQAKAKKKF